MSTITSRVFAGFLSAVALSAASAIALAQGAATPAEPPAKYDIPAGTPAYIKNAIENSARNPEQKAIDAARKPAELLVLSGVKPGDKVVEFASFGQYFTTLISDIIGPKGMVYMYDLPYTGERAGPASRAFVEGHKNAKYELIDYNALKLPQDVDVVFNVLYYHDLSLNSIDVAVLNKKIFDALKPGGIFFIVDHNAAPGSGTRDTKQLHRIDPEVIKAEVKAAGFELVEDSKLLANPADDHTKMVFAPGTRRHTDQAVLKFRKPAKK